MQTVIDAILGNILQSLDGARWATEHITLGALSCVSSTCEFASLCRPVHAALVCLEEELEVGSIVLNRNNSKSPF
jgi:hypothetical protein